MCGRDGCGLIGEFGLKVNLIFAAAQQKDHNICGVNPVAGREFL
jgi:hypothetical protein